MLRLDKLIKPWKEAAALNDHINLYGFWNQTAFLTKSGDLGMILSVPGVDYESLDRAAQDYAVKRLEAALKVFGPGFHVYQYLFKSNRPDIPFAHYEDPVVEAANDQRRQFFEARKDQLYQVEIFYAIVLEGPRSKSGIGAALARLLTDPAGGIGELKAQFSNGSMKTLLRAQISLALSPLKQLYLPCYVRTAVAGTLHKTGKYQLLFVMDSHRHSRLAVEEDATKGTTPEPDGKPLPLALSTKARAAGLLYLYRGPKLPYLNKPLHTYFRIFVYGGDGIWEMFRLPLLFGLAALLLQLPFSIARDVKRRKEMKYGRRLRGAERLTPKQFAAKVAGDGIGIRTEGRKELLRIPARAEAQHIQIIGDTGAGKTTIILQMLRQIRGRGDSAIIYDPALEFTRRFYDEKNGDIILNPLDKRCPYWGPAEELRRSSEADAIAVSLFQPPQDKKGEFFIEIPQQIFSHLLRYGPTPQQLVQWMSDPREIDARVKGTEAANFIDPAAGPQRVGVLASLSKVARSLRLLPLPEAANGRWSATEWAETRKGWIFITSLPAEREALRPLQSVWIDMLVLRLLNEPKPDQKRVWFVLDELASLQRLPQFHTALTENRKSNNPIIMGFQGKAQLEVNYGHLAEVMLSQPSTSIYLKTKETNAGEWVSKAIGKVEIERLKETKFDGSRSGRNFTLDRQIEPVVMESEISGLPDLHAFLKYQNYVTGFSFPYLDVPGDQVAFDLRTLPEDRLIFDPKNIHGAPEVPLLPAAPAVPFSQPSPFASPPAWQKPGPPTGPAIPPIDLTQAPQEQRQQPPFSAPGPQQSDLPFGEASQPELLLQVAPDTADSVLHVGEN